MSLNNPEYMSLCLARYKDILLDYFKGLKELILHTQRDNQIVS